MFSFKSYNLNEAKEYILWGLPKGKTDPLYQEILSTQSKTPAQVEEVKRRAAKEGWHSFRVQILDMSQPFEWSAKKMVKEGTEHLYEVPRDAPKPLGIVKVGGRDEQYTRKVKSAVPNCHWYFLVGGKKSAVLVGGNGTVLERIKEMERSVPRRVSAFKRIPSPSVYWVWTNGKTPNPDPNLYWMNSNLDVRGRNFNELKLQAEERAMQRLKEATEHLYEVPRGAPKHPITIVDYILDGAVLKTYKYTTLVGLHQAKIQRWLASGSLPDGTAPQGEKRAVKVNGKLKTFKKI